MLGHDCQMKGVCVCACAAFVFNKDDYHQKLCCFDRIWFVPVKVSVRPEPVVE